MDECVKAIWLVFLRLHRFRTLPRAALFKSHIRTPHTSHTRDQSNMCMCMAGTYVYAYVHMYVCMCVCVSVYVCEWQGYMCKCMHMCNNIHLHSAHLGIARMYLRCVCACARVSACVMCMRNPSASSTSGQSSTSLLPSPRTRTLHCV